MAKTGPTMVRPSAALVLARDRTGGGIEVFMVRRHAASPFMPDVYVFPGGSVTEADYAAEQTSGLCAPVDDGPTALGHGVRAAALRECFEEAGVLLARQHVSHHGDRDTFHHGGTETRKEHGEHERLDTSAVLPVTTADAVVRYAAYRDALNVGSLTLAEIATRERLTLATDLLLYWAHWIAPEALSRRFDTRFFLAAMPEGQRAAHDRLETTEGAWMRPEDALARGERGDFPLVFATIHQLRALTDLSNVADAYQRFANRPVAAIMPRIVQRNGQEVILLPGEV